MAGSPKPYPIEKENQLLNVQFKVIIFKGVLGFRKILELTKACHQVIAGVALAKLA